MRLLPVDPVGHEGLVRPTVVIPMPVARSMSLVRPVLVVLAR
jgi:hypothetical protein